MESEKQHGLLSSESTGSRPSTEEIANRKTTHVCQEEQSDLEGWGESVRVVKESKSFEYLDCLCCL
jgi:hypothetical protein